MNLNSSVDTIYGELSERQDCLDWLHERTGQNWYVVSIEEGYAFEIVHYFDADLGCRDGLALFMVFLAVRIDDERVKRQSVLLPVICMWQSTDFIGTNVDKIDKSTKQNQYD